MTKKQKRTAIQIAVSLVLTLIFAFLPVNTYVKFVLFLIPYLSVGYEILFDACRGILNRQPFDENFLMAVATIGAFALGEYSEAVLVMLFYQLGELFQSYAVGKSRQSISSLMDIRPDYVYIEDENKQLIKKDPYDIEIGDYIFVKPGDKIALDGIIEEGNSTLDTVALTGESVPRSASVGDEVLSGFVNMSGLIKVRVTKLFDESTASKVLELVENATFNKSKSEKFISKFARIYTPIVCLSALAFSIIPPTVIFLINGNNTFGEWIYRALTFLVISCPCALVVSVPLSFFAGIGGAGKKGILIKGANYLEALANTKYVVFDKTGTLTEGVFEITDIHDNKIPEEELIEYACLAEIYSTHPISESLRKSYIKPLDKSRVLCFTEKSGFGVSATIDGKSVLVGNSKLMNENNIEYTECDGVGAVLHIAIDGVYQGHILISDRIKANSGKAVNELKNIGVKKCCMLTGDRKLIGEYVAKKTGIDEVHTELLPTDKVSIVSEMLTKKQDKDKLVFVGDGINDAPVLACSDIGVAMGALGSDAAIEAADVVLMDDDPYKLVSAIKIAKKCMSIVYSNIYFAIGVKILFLILGALGKTNMWHAIFADVGVMVLAVLNSIRAMNVRKL